METGLWWICGIIAALILGIALIPEIYRRVTRRREKRLGHRSKRRIKL